MSKHGKKQTTRVVHALTRVHGPSLTKNPIVMKIAQRSALKRLSRLQKEGRRPKRIVKVETDLMQNGEISARDDIGESDVAVSITTGGNDSEVREHERLLVVDGSRVDEALSATSSDRNASAKVLEKRIRGKTVASVKSIAKARKAARMERFIGLNKPKSSQIKK